MVPCMSRGLAQKVNDLIVPVAIFDDDDRRTEAEFAKENGIPLKDVQSRYAATGEIVCNGKPWGSANLTLYSDVVTTSAHLFYNPDSCREERKIQDCRFKTKVGTSIQESEIESITGMGFECPSLPSPSQDWAVLKLKSKIEGVVPYSVSPDAELVSGQKVTSVLAKSVDFHPKGKGDLRWPKSIGHCSVGKMYYSSYGKAVYFSTNCDSSSWGSGGAVLIDSGKVPVLVAIHRGSDETEQQLNEAVRTGRPNIGSHVAGKWASYKVYLKDAFLAATIEAGK